MDLAEPDRAGFVDVNGTRLRVWEWGNPTDTPVILVHGAYDHGRMFDDLAPRIAALGFHAVAVDLRGHGDSGRLATGNIWLASTTDLGLLARRLGGNAGFVAHSFGGGQALCVAGIFPEDVAWIVDIDGLGPPSAAIGIDDPAAVAAKAFDTLERVLTRPPREYASQADMASRRRQVNVRMTEDWAAHLVRHGSQAGPQGGWVWKVDPMFGVGLPGPFDRDLLLAEFRQAKCPVLVLTGTEPDTWSDLDPEERASRMAVLVDARHGEVEGAGHYAHLERPDAVMEHIERFLAEVAR